MTIVEAIFTLSSNSQQAKELAKTQEVVKTLYQFGDNSILLIRDDGMFCCYKDMKHYFDDLNRPF